MSLTLLGIGIGEGGGRLASSFADHGVNIGLINTNQGDLNGIRNIPESKKLLLNISDGGSGKDPNFVKESLKNPEYRKQITSFISKLLKTTPVFTNCTHCNSEEKLKDTELVGDVHTCSTCNAEFGVKNIQHRAEVKHNYLFLFACLGGGSGSGLISDVIDLCYTNLDIPIAVICTIPDDAEDTVSKVNAISIFKELYNKYALNGIISPFIVIDNQKMMEMYNLPLGSMFKTINESVADIVNTFNQFSNMTSKAGKTVDMMDTARLWAEGGCCTLGKFTVGNNALKRNKYEINVETFYDLDLIEEAMNKCTFVDGFDLSTATAVGVVVVAPNYFLDTEETSNTIKYVYGKVKEIIGDGTIYRAQYDDPNSDCLEFYLFYNGLKYPEERFERMWQEVKEGKAIAARKRNRIDGVTYDIDLESHSLGKNFKKLQDIQTNESNEKPVIQQKSIKRATKRCSNCFQDPITKKSMGIYNKKGPVPFTGICPVCKGEGKEYVP